MCILLLQMLQVYMELEAIGAASAEARARRILAVGSSHPAWSQPLCEQVVLSRVWGSLKRCRDGPQGSFLEDGE